LPRLSTIVAGTVTTVARSPRQWFAGLWHDVRHGARVFARSPAFTAIAITSIAFGTGANVAMFSLADTLLLRPLPVQRPSELLTIGTRETRGLSTRHVCSYPDYVDIRARTKSFVDLVASDYFVAGLAQDRGGSPQVRLLSLVNGDFFTTLGVQPALGRGFLPEEDRVEERDAVVILSHAMWQQEFAGDPHVLGRKLFISGVEFTVVGVAPESFTGLHSILREAAFVPLAMWPRVQAFMHVNPLHARDLRALTVRGRLAPGVTLTEARAELAAIGGALELAYPDTHSGRTLTAQTELAMRFERSPLDSWLMVVLTTLSIAVLCVACANVAGLLASRAPVRSREIALRLAVGAARARLVRQLITESLGIAFAGGLAGLALGHVGVMLLRQIQFPTEVLTMPTLQLDRRAFIYSVVIATASAFAFGLGPAIQTTRVNLVSSLKTGDVEITRRQRLLGRNMLVALQVAMCLVILTVSVWAYRVFGRAFAEGPGFRTTHIAKIRLDPGQARYDEAEAARFFIRALEAAKQIPGASHTAVTSAMPLFSWESTLIVPERYHLPEGQTSVRSYSNSVDEQYFSTMEIPILAGRAFSATDDVGGDRVAIVNDTLARHYWPNDDPIGKRFVVDGEAGEERRRGWVTIIGVAKTSAYGYFAEPPQDMVFFPFRQMPRGNMVLLVRSDRESHTLVGPLRDVARSLDTSVPAYDAQTMEVFYAARVTTIGTVMTRLIGGMGLMGLTLTMVGLYGLVSYSVSRRTREIGIRVAIGATHRRVLGMILRQGMVPALWGMLAGAGLSAAMTRLLRTVVPLNSRYDADTFAIVIPLVVVVTLLAAFVPARRAARVHPSEALRCE
jgi:macrolide transport system ATP-binding/permease protein